MKRKIAGQSTIEYFVVFTLILALLISTSFIGRVRAGFETFFNAAVAKMSTS